MTASFAVETGPSAVAFDGFHVWVTNFSSNNVTELLASTGATLGTFTVGNSPQSMAFDDANIWVADYGSSIVQKL